MIDGTLFKLILKKDWIKLTSFLVGLAALTVGVAAYFPTLYKTQVSRDAMVNVLQSPAMAALFGPANLKQPYNTAEIFGYEMLIWVILVAVIANLTIAIPNSRGDEERGIVEVLLARAMSRRQWLNTIVAELVAYNMALTLINGVGLRLVHLPGATAAGDWLFATVVGVTGLVFGLLSLLLGQIFSTSRNTTIVAYVLMLVSYLIMAMASAANHLNWTWAALIAWGTETRVYITNTWWPVGLLLIAGIIFYAVSDGLLRQRDLAAGLIPDRPGRAQASEMLRGPATLLIRTQGLTAMVWIGLIFVFGYAYGSVFNMMGDLAKNNQVVSHLIAGNGGQTVILNFLVLLLVLFGVIGAVPGIMIINHLVSDEKHGYLESLHAKPVARTQLFGVYVGLGWLLSLLVLAAGILGIYVGARMNMPHPLAFKLFWQAFVAMIVPVTVMVAGQSLLVGSLPQLKNFIWVFAYLAFFYGYFGNMLKLPHWLGHFTPYGWLPKVPVANMDWVTGSTLLGLAVIFLLVGAVAYRHRDLVIG